MDDFKPFIAKVATGASLSRDEARDAFDTILSGGVTNAQAAAFLMALRVRGETTEEITGAVGAMRGKMLTVEAPADAIDIVGTGGDSSGSYNVSTLASIITAASCQIATVVAKGDEISGVILIQALVLLFLANRARTWQVSDHFILSF